LAADTNLAAKTGFYRWAAFFAKSRLFANPASQYFDIRIES